MPDLTIQAVIALGIDPQKAAQIVAATDAATKGLQSAQKQAAELKKQFADIAQAGEKLRFVGTAIAASGAGILAPFILSAQQYANTYKTLEKTSADYLAAQKRQTDATTALGRVSASVLIPVMNQIADFEDKIASFAEAHPEMVKIAVGAGTALVAGGGALVAAGAAVSTLAKSAELIQKFTEGDTGAAAGSIARAGVGIAAFGAGLEAGTLLLNALGKATGDTRLATYSLSDALKTARELAASAFLLLGKGIGALYVQWGSLPDVVKGLFELGSVGIQKVILDLQDAVNKFIVNIALALNQYGIVSNSQLLDVLKTTGGQAAANQKKRSDLDEQGAGNASDITAGNAARQAQVDAMLKNMADAAANFGENGSLGKGLDSLIGGIKNAFSGGSGGSKSASPLVSPEGVQDYIEYSQKLKDMDKTDKQDLLDQKKTFDDGELKAEQDKQAQADKINSDYMANSLKETSDFLDTEQKEQKNANKERVRLLQDLNDSLFNAAASNDVVAFLNAQRQGNKDLDRQKEDAGDADKQRIADFQKQQRTEANQRQTALNDLDKSFKEQDAARRSDYAEQRNALLSKQQQERQLVNQDFAQKLAGLAGNLAGLSDIQQGYYADQTKAFQAYLDTNKTALQNAIKSSYGIGGNGSSAAASSSDSSSALSQQRAGERGYAKGTDYVPHDGLFYLHKGESVKTVAQNKQGHTVTVDMRGAMLTGGATQADLDKLHSTIVSGVTTAIAAAGAN